MNKILFLCSGNYYRSRMAEEYFNHCAKQKNINWIADSMALRKDLEKTGNIGPLSTFARQQLEKNNIKIQNGERMPRTLVPEELGNFKKVISMSMREHKPMIENSWIGVFEKMDYWEVGDIGIDPPEEAFLKIRREVENLIEQIYKR